jgi:hypothetical protein
VVDKPDEQGDHLKNIGPLCFPLISHILLSTPNTRSTCGSNQYYSFVTVTTSNLLQVIKHRRTIITCIKTDVRI